jgi:hypothetical protein
MRDVCKALIDPRNRIEILRFVVQQMRDEYLLTDAEKAVE